MTIISFTSTAADLETAGGKGTNLAHLTRAGFPVPDGFIISTDVYRTFVIVNHLADMVATAITRIAADDPVRLESVSSQIRAAFSAGQIPDETQTTIRLAYGKLSGVPVAVRSSATTEDLPDLSFAGQQDTYLNILGEEELFKAVVNCWSSLWTARAIGYRIRNGISHDQAALAVVVQEMVQSDVSGVLFTANPLTGLLSEAVIDATFGLGEALVSGQVDPDHFVVDALSGVIVSKTLGDKKLLTRGKKGGGLETIEQHAGARQTLSDNEIKQLVVLGQQVQDEFGRPQDLEWALASGNLYLLQSRAITSLFPIPEVSFDPLQVWISLGAIQGLLGPMTPLGRDTIQNMAAGAGTMFGLHLEPEEVTGLASAGERLWIKISDLVRHPIGRRTFDSAIEYIEPSVGQILSSLAVDPRLGAGTGKLKFSTLIRLARFALPVLPPLARYMLWPDKGRSEFEAQIEVKLAAAQITPATDRFGRLANSVEFMLDHIAPTFSLMLPRFIPLIGPSMAGLNLLNKFAGENRATALEVTRSLPHNVTIEMDLALWETATEIKADPEAARVFDASDAPTLAFHYLSEDLPPLAQTAIARFMAQYGMRGVGELDIGRPRWREEPTPVMHTLQSYLNIEADFAPDILFAGGEQAAHAAVEKLAAEARKQRAGRIKEKLVRTAARRIRLLMGARESPKFFIIRLMGIARQAILNAGNEFVEAGTITHADDLFFLQLGELELLARNEAHDWKALIAERRAAYEREMRRRQVPRVLVSDGRAFYEGLGAKTDSSDLITGSPVSPGVVEGIVQVVFDPNDTQLAPGEILVCPGTDPAWTPLMMAASGLVTEVGGMMTHGSVVAREFGIPAVVGVHQATQRLKNGQTIRLDGTTGKIMILS